MQVVVSFELMGTSSRKVSVPHPDVFWAYCFLEVKDWIVQWYPKTSKNISKILSVQKYLIFNAFGEGFS